MLRKLAVLSTVLLVFVGCGNGGEVDESDQTIQQPEETEEARAEDRSEEGNPVLTIEAPTEEASVAAGSVEVEVSVEHFDVVDKLGEPAVDGEGHIHFYKDVDAIPTAPGRPAVTEDASTYHATATTSHTWENVEAGEHTFGVQLVNNDHTPLDPPITAEVTVTVGG